MTRTFFCIAVLLASSKVAARGVEVHVFDWSPSTQFQLIEPGRNPDAIARGEPPASPKLEAFAARSEPVALELDIMPQRLLAPADARSEANGRQPVGRRDGGFAAPDSRSRE